MVPLRVDDRVWNLSGIGRGRGLPTGQHGAGSNVMMHVSQYYPMLLTRGQSLFEMWTKVSNTEVFAAVAMRVVATKSVPGV